MKALRPLSSLGPRYMALWVGQTVSQFGTFVAFLTLPLLVLHLQEAIGEGSTLDFSITFALETVPTLFVGLIGGVLLDRVQLRPVMLVTDLLRASAFFYLAASVGTYGLLTVFVMAFLVGSMTTLFDAALYSLIPALVPKNRLAQANGFMAASEQANTALGPLAAGVFAAISGGPELGLFVNGLTFVVSAISLLWVGRVVHHGIKVEDRSPVLTEAANGLRYIWSEPRLRISTTAASIANFVMGFVEATFVVLAFWVLGAENETEVGVLLAAMGVGGVVGALTASRFIGRLGLGRTMVLGLAWTGIGLFVVMFTDYGLVALGLQVLWVIGVALINVPLATIRQHYAAPAMMGRVISGSRAIAWATLPIGALIGGWLGSSQTSYPLVARSFPLLLVGAAIWLSTTVIWSDTYGPGARPVGEPAPAEA